jgi:hypothetical protein
MSGVASIFRARRVPGAAVALKGEEPRRLLFFISAKNHFGFNLRAFSHSHQLL